MFDLPQFFVERSTSDQGSFFSVVTVHELVVIDEVALRHLDYFNGDNQRNWDHGVDEYEIGEKVQNSINDRLVAPLDVSIN